MDTAIHGHRWTDEELKQLMAMWIEDKPVTEIGTQFGISGLAVQKKVYELRRNGIPLMKRRRGHKNGRTNKPWTQEEVEYLTRRRIQGATMDEIALDLSRTFCGVQAMIGSLRSEQIAIPRYGRGLHRLWSPEKLRGAMIGRQLAESK